MKFASTRLSADYSAIVPNEMRRHILSAAIGVVTEHELENVTMDRIAVQAGVTRLKLYREFGNRSALIEAVIAFRLMLFDERFFAETDCREDFSRLIEQYLSESTYASRQNPVSRRWASGSMKFIYVGSLVHRTAVATWSPFVGEAHTTGQLDRNICVDEIALWLMMLQYSLGKMVVDTDITKSYMSDMINKFVLPAFRDSSG